MQLRYFFLFFFTSIWVFGQTDKKIDSLNQLYTSYQNKDLLKALDYAEQAVQLSEAKQTETLTLISYNNYFDILYKLRSIELAETINLKMMSLAQQLNDKKMLSIAYLNASNLSRKERDYDKSLIDIEDAISISQHYKLFNTEHKSLNTKVLLLRSVKNNEKALKLIKTILNNKNFKNTYDVARTYSHLGGLYFKHLHKKDSSTYYYKKAIDLVKNSDNEYLKTILYINYGDLLLQTDKKKEGVDYLELAKETAIKSNNFRILYNIISSLGIYYNQNEEHDKAIEKFKEAEEKYGKYTRKEAIAHLYWMLSEAYYLNDQPEEAYLTQEKLLYLRDSLFTIEKNKTFEKLQTEYEVENKNNQIQLLEKEKELEANRKKLVLGVGGLLLLVLGLLVFNYKNKVRSQKLIREKEQKLHQQEKEQLEKDQKIKRIEGYIEGEEKEKNRIAIELHDGIGGQLSGIKHYVASLPKNTEQEVLIKNVSNVTKEVRILSHSLSTNFSMHQSFNNLLQTLKQQYKNHFDIEFVVFPEEEIDKIDKEQKLFLYRTIQEILNNTYKHAQANFVSVNLTITDGVVLIVEDNGKGFSVDATPKGIGLQNIQEKLETWKGSFRIDAALGRGTTVVINLPK